jgi:hypothetical protein
MIGHVTMLSAVCADSQVTEEGVRSVGARHKLNTVHIVGALGAAAVLGAVVQSWPVFLVAAAVLITGLIHSGDIRLRNRRR